MLNQRIEIATYSLHNKHSNKEERMNSIVNHHTSIKVRSHWIRDWWMKKNEVRLEQISGKDYPITNQISTGRNARATLIPPINSRNFLVMQSGVGDTGKQYISPKLTIPTSSCIHPSTHNQEKLRKSCTSTFEKHPLYKLWQYSWTPQYWVTSRLSHQQLHKRDFRCR